MTAVPSAACLLLFCLWRQKISSKIGHLPCVPDECLYFGGATTIFFGCPIRNRILELHFLSIVTSLTALKKSEKLIFTFVFCLHFCAGRTPGTPAELFCYISSTQPRFKYYFMYLKILKSKNEYNLVGCIVYFYLKRRPLEYVIKSN